MISIIQDVESFSNPKIDLEQYCIDATSAVDIIFFAGVEFNDISNRIVIDLGCGTGRLSIAAAYLQAKSILSIDIDIDALRILRKNLQKLELDLIISPIRAEIKNFNISNQNFPKSLKITTIMNPPFGVQKRKADRVFLEKAFSFSHIVYSIHLSSSSIQNFIKNYIKKYNWEIDYIFPYQLELEKTYPFHSFSRKKIDVDIYRYRKKNN